MAEGDGAPQAQGQQQAAAEPQGEGPQQPDYKALYERTIEESRKWEKRAKASAGAQRQLDSANQAAKTAEERIAELESRIAARDAADERRALVAKVAQATGVAQSLVEALNGADEEALTEQAKAIADLGSTYPATRDAGGSGGQRTPSAAAQFAEVFSRL